MKSSVVGYWNQIWENRDKSTTCNLFALKVRDYIQEGVLGKKILDVGAGKGADSIFFQELGFNVTSLDVSDIGLQEIKKFCPKIKTIHSSILEADLGVDKYDVIYAHLSLHYFDEKDTTMVFQKLYEALKKDGLMFVKCKSIKDKLFGKGEEISSNIYKYKHIRHFFSKEYMRNLLVGLKYKNIEIIENNSVYHNNDSHFVEGIGRK